MAKRHFRPLFPMLPVSPVVHSCSRKSSLPFLGPFLAALRSSSCHPSSCPASPLRLSIALLAGLAVLLARQIALACNPPDPAIARSPSSLSRTVKQGANAASQTFQVWNSSAGTLNYTISKNQTWLSVSPTSGSSTGEQDTITVSYSTSSLGAGAHNATITIADSYASNSPQTISVTVTVMAPQYRSNPAMHGNWGG